MKQLFTSLLLMCSFIGYSQNQQFKEYQQFYIDIFHDSSIYTFTDFEQDSTALQKEIKQDSFLFTLYPKGSNYLNTELKCNIDTLFSPFRIKSKCGCYHFNELVIEKTTSHFGHPSSIKEENDFIQNYIFRDSILDSIEFNENLNEYHFAQKKFKLSFTDKNITVVNSKKLKRLIGRDYNWKGYYEKYHSPLLVVSIPFFNKTKTQAYFEFSVVFGRLNAIHYAGNYKKIDGKWVAILVYQIGVS